MSEIRNVEMSPDEQPYAWWIAQDIEVTWQGYERMPPEAGKVIVSDVDEQPRSHRFEKSTHRCPLSPAGLDG